MSVSVPTRYRVRVDSSQERERGSFSLTPYPVDEAMLVIVQSLGSMTLRAAAGTGPLVSANRASPHWVAPQKSGFDPVFVSRGVAAALPVVLSKS